MAQANARQWQRYSYRADVQLRWGTGDFEAAAAEAAPPTDRYAVCGGRAINLSQGGLQLRATEAPSVGAAVSCELSCAGRWTALPGRVRWRSQPLRPDLGTELGIEFGPLSHEQCESVRALLASVAGTGQPVELELPALRQPLPARALLTDRGVRLRAKLPIFATGSELAFELSDPPLRFAGRIVSCELQHADAGLELELLIEEREAPRSRRYTMYQLPQLDAGRSPGSRRSTLAGATSPLPVLTAAVRETSALEPANDPRRLEAPPPTAARVSSQLAAAELTSSPLLAAPALLLTASAPAAALRRSTAPAGERRRNWLVEQPYPAPFEARALPEQDRDTDEFPRVPKTRAPRLISQLLAVLLGFTVAITLGRSALRQREEDEAAAREDANHTALASPQSSEIAAQAIAPRRSGAGADPNAPAVFVPTPPGSRMIPLHTSAAPGAPSDGATRAAPAPGASPAAVAVPAPQRPAATLTPTNASSAATPLAVSAPQRPAATLTPTNASSAATPLAVSAPQRPAATLTPTNASSAATPLAVSAPQRPVAATTPTNANVGATTPIVDVADRPTVQVTGDTTEVFVPVKGELQGWHEAIWVEPIALVIDLPEGARVAFPQQRFAYHTGGVMFVGAGVQRGVTQIRVFLDGLLARYAIQARSTGLMIRLRRDLQPMR